jgi:hypothetical protein
MSGSLRDNIRLYFAYGSNLCTVQMAERCPSRRFFARALLPDHALVFPRRSGRRNCGVAGIVSCPGRVVWGAVYRLTADDIARLDRSEGHIPGRDPAANAYNKRDIAVLRDGACDDIIRALPTSPCRCPAGIFRAPSIAG